MENVKLLSIVLLINAAAVALTGSWDGESPLISVMAIYGMAVTETQMYLAARWMLRDIRNS